MTEIHNKPEIPGSAGTGCSNGSPDAADLQFDLHDSVPDTSGNGSVARVVCRARAELHGHGPLSPGLRSPKHDVLSSDVQSAPDDHGQNRAGTILSLPETAQTSELQTHSAPGDASSTSSSTCAPVIIEPEDSDQIRTVESGTSIPDPDPGMRDSPAVPEKPSQPSGTRVSVTSASIRRAPSFKLSLDSQAPRRNSTECVVVGYRHRKSFADLAAESTGSRSLTGRVGGASSTPDVSAADRDSDRQGGSQASGTPTPTLRVTRASMRRRSVRSGRTTPGHSDGRISPAHSGGRRTSTGHISDRRNSPGHVSHRRPSSGYTGDGSPRTTELRRSSSGRAGGAGQHVSPVTAQHRWRDLAEVMRRYRDDGVSGDTLRDGEGGCELGGRRLETGEEEEEEGRLVKIVFSNVCYLLPVKTDVPKQEEHLFDVSDLQHEPPLISKCGSLEVTFTYDSSKSKMAVHIHRAREIPAKDRGGANNTQVRVMLLPTKKQRFKTKVKEGQDPAYDESFTFSKVTPDEAPGMGLRFRLYGLERMRRERMIGESVIGFASLNLDEPSTHWVILEPRSNLSHGDSGFDVSSLSRSDSASSTQSLQHGGMPELLMGLAYNGTTGRLAVQVIKGSNFRNMAMNRAPDTYVKVTLMSPTGQELQRCKTSVRRGQPNPLFKETFMLQVALFQLPDVTLMVSVYNKKSMKKKEMIGWFSLGQNSSGEEESSHWTDMRESKGEEVCRWHVLLES